MPWETFWCEPTGEADVGLRRYRYSDGDDISEHFHSAQRIIERAPTRFSTTRQPDDKPDCFLASIPTSEFADHPWWPVQCGCGYFFIDDDEWQVTQEVIYRAVDGRGEWPMHSLPIGAMFDSCWVGGSWRNPADDLAVTVILPPGGPYEYWNTDGPATHQEADPTPEDPAHTRSVLVPHAWTRAGDPRVGPISVTPSIQTSSYHGFLTDGQLTDPM